MERETETADRNNRPKQINRWAWAWRRNKTSTWR
jgi:hypothetical protein